MIYEHYFQLSQRPFSIAPNPQFLYEQGQYREALAALEFGLTQNGGFVLLTGEVGTGKTTLCKQLLTKVPQGTETALVLHPQLNRMEFLLAVCDEFGIEVENNGRIDGGELKLIHLIHRFLLKVFADGRNAVLIIDEAQHLDVSVLELVRLLTNLETNEEKLLQIILIGQPELKERLERYDLRQLNQRITVRYHLAPLGLMETCRYVRHRLAVVSNAQDKGQGVFSFASLLVLHRLTKGIPRLVNVVADRALMAAYATDSRVVGGWLLSKAAQEVLPGSKGSARRAGGLWKSVVGLSFAAVIGFGFLQANVVENGFGGVVSNLAQMATGESAKFAEEPVSQRFSKNQSRPLARPLDSSFEQLAPFWAVSESKICNEPRYCWQGQLPLSLLRTSGVPALVHWQYQWQPVSQLENLNRLADEGLAVQDMVEVRMVWQPPFAFDSALKRGDRSDAVAWLKQQLSLQSVTTVEINQDWEVIAPASGATVMPPSSLTRLTGLTYDALLEQRVRSFQSSMGLEVDGIAGSQTLLTLWLVSQSQSAAQMAEQF